MWKKVKWETTKYGWENKNKELVGKERIVQIVTRELPIVFWKLFFVFK